jgi:UDP-N-acetyl-D-mannosaminuronic acid dehydrogenase
VAQDLKDKYKVAIIGGAGHVGVPLTICFAEAGIKTLVIDINTVAMESIMNGELPFIEHGAESLLKSALAKKLIECTTEISKISQCNAVILTIGTPVDEFLNPTNQVVKKCIDDLLPYLHDNQLIIFRSTIFPGTIDWLDKYLQLQNKHIKLAFCPERVVQGHGILELKSLPQIVSGTSEEAIQAASKLFLKIAPEVVCVMPMEAEFAKLFNNAYRYIEFATTNQFYMIAQSAGVDYQKILYAMKHNYPRSAKIPGPGLAAGPCLLKDTMQLAAFSGNQFTLGHAAMNVNEGLVLYILDQLSQTYDLQNMVVGIMGMAFKADIDDTRSSLSYKLKKSLLFKAKKVLTADPYVQGDKELIPIETLIQESDILVLCAPHSLYKSIDLRGKPVFDVWGFFE